MRGFDELTQVIGETAASALCAAKGGRSVYIPETGAGALGELLSADQVDRMRDTFGAQLPYTVPMGPCSAREVVRLRGLELLAKDRSVCDVAREVGVHPVTVKRWRKRSESQR